MFLIRASLVLGRDNPVLFFSFWEIHGDHFSEPWIKFKNCPPLAEDRVTFFFRMRSVFRNHLERFLRLKKEETETKIADILYELQDEQHKSPEGYRNGIGYNRTENLMC